MRIWAVMLDQGVAGRTLISLWSTEELAQQNLPSRDYVVEEWLVDVQ
jgi:hypothetical protein